MLRTKIAPTGDQFTIADSGYQAVITEGGAALRSLEYDARPLLDGFAADEMPTGGRGQILMPWPNRIGDGRYEFDGQTYQLPLSEPALNNASHGLVRWVAWTVVEHIASSIALRYRLMSQSGYPWTLDLLVTYAVGPDGLTVTQTATNRSTTSAPYASGAHPYLTLGEQIDTLELLLPAGARLTTDDRKLPTGSVDLTGSEFDHRTPHPIGDTRWDHAVTDLTRAGGRCWVSMKDPQHGSTVALWADSQHNWLQVYSGDANPFGRRRSLAVEPMTAPPDAFRSGTDLVHLAPGATTSASWGMQGHDEVTALH